MTILSDAVPAAHTCLVKPVSARRSSKLILLTILVHFGNRVLGSRHLEHYLLMQAHRTAAYRGLSSPLAILNRLRDECRNVCPWFCSVAKRFEATHDWVGTERSKWSAAPVSLRQHGTNRNCTRGIVKALVRWATGKRLTDRLPKLSLITLSPPLNSGILGLRMGLYVPTPMFFYNLWGPRESDSSDS